MTFIPPRTNARQDSILTAIVAQLQTVCGLTELQCYISASPYPPYDPPADIFIQVWSPHGTFDPGLFDGGGSFQTNESTTVTVTIYSGLKLDEAGRDPVRAADASVGMLNMKRKVLKAIAGFEPAPAAFASGIIAGGATSQGSTTLAMALPNYTDYWIAVGGDGNFVGGDVRRITSWSFLSQFNTVNLGWSQDWSGSAYVVYLPVSVRDVISPIDSNAPQNSSDGDYLGRIQLAFQVNFDWDLG